eukprot:Clim_evm32s22 gene=Clim_evmTU32s22
MNTSKVTILGLALVATAHGMSRPCPDQFPHVTDTTFNWQEAITPYFLQSNRNYKYEYLSATAEVFVPEGDSYFCVQQDIYAFPIDGFDVKTGPLCDLAKCHPNVTCKEITRPGVHNFPYRSVLTSSLQGDYDQKYFVKSTMCDGKVHYANFTEDFSHGNANVTIDGYSNVDCTSSPLGNICTQNLDLAFSEGEQMVLISDVWHASSCGGCPPGDIVANADAEGYTDANGKYYGWLYPGGPEYPDGYYLNYCENIVGSTVNFAINQLVALNADGMATVSVNCPQPPSQPS